MASSIDFLAFPQELRRFCVRFRIRAGKAPNRHLWPRIWLVKAHNLLLALLQASHKVNEEIEEFLDRKLLTALSV